MININFANKYYYKYKYLLISIHLHAFIPMQIKEIGQYSTVKSRVTQFGITSIKNSFDVPDICIYLKLFISLKLFKNVLYL